MLCVTRLTWSGHVLLFLYVSLFAPAVFSVDYDPVPPPEAIFEIEELAVKQVKAAWELTNIDPGENVTMSISEFWRQLKMVLQTIHVELKKYDRRILNNRPSSLMNKVLDLQDLATLKTLSDSNSKNPFIKWRVKWVELSSMASHIHRLYNKRLRDIMNDEPYIKTVAQSVQKYMGYPWYSKLSGNIDDNYRFLMRHFPQWIEQRMLSVIEGDLFLGLRRLIDENPTAKSSSSMESGDCKGTQTMGRIVPSSLEGPIYVLIYMALVDIKYYILINFYYIYLWVYESIPFFKHDSLAEEMKERLEKKVEMYGDAFRGFGKKKEKMPAPVAPGYFRCDPPQALPDIPTRSHVYKFTFFKVTNFLKVFIAPEKNFRASGTCKGSCDMIDGTRAPCNESDPDCLVDFEDECVKNPAACKGFKPPCPLEDTVCIDSAVSGSYCPSKKKERMVEWAKMGEKTFGPDTTSCAEPLVSLNGSWVMETEAVADTPTMCEVCLCHCYSPIGDDMSTVRAFSLKPALSSVAENKIVVGVKFELVKDQIHLMIAEAKAMPKGKVDISTLVWRKPRPANESMSPPQLIKLRRNLRIVHLDDLTAPPNHVVTGVRFIQSSYEGVYLHEYIGIQIQVHEVNPSSGAVVESSGKWIGNDNSSISREPYNYVDPDDPVRADGPALPDSSSNQFVSFRATSVTKDMGQNTIPYFDAQRVILDEGKNGWLRGIGIFHKARPRFGGFLALKIITYDDK